MKITLTDLGKRFNREWIFRHLNFEFTSPGAYAITGPNGSGKSTLLQVIAGAVGQSEGKVNYYIPATDANSAQSESGNGVLESEQVYSQISLAAPYLELVEEMTLLEFLNFHHLFKPFISIVSSDQIIAELDLEESAHKQMRYFSSGMKQRVKLAQAIFTDTPVLLLDEPCTNLDEEGIALYHQLIGNYAENRLVVVSSNDVEEYRFCARQLHMADYKT
ncbi:MAG TPA: ATP-binding cassette domain-containing protein [Puia sp.]|nr:ATP-binding cassette domain-containing protein [Puia sp.]